MSAHWRTLMSIRHHAAQGQVLAPGAIILLGFVLLIFALVGAATQWGDVETVASATRLAAIAGARAYNPSALAAGQVGLDTTGEAAGAARHIFVENLRRAFGGRYPRVDTIATALASEVHVIVFSPTPAQPTYADPDPAAGGATYTYATVCVSADLMIGLGDAHGAGFMHHFHACAQAV